MKLIACLLMVLGFSACNEKTQEQQDFEEIVQNEEVGKIELK